MNRFVQAWLGYLVVTFIVAAVWHLVLFKSLYEQLAVFTRAEPIIWLGVLSMVLQGAVMAYLFPVFWRKGNPLAAGVLLGLLLGVFMGSNAVLGEAGKNEVSSLPTWIVLESVFYLLHGALAGLAVGFLSSRGQSPRSGA